jgi:hypothetical protein
VVNYLFWGRNNRISGDVICNVVLSDAADELTEIEIWHMQTLSTDECEDYTQIFPSQSIISLARVHPHEAARLQHSMEKSAALRQTELQTWRQPGHPLNQNIVLALRSSFDRRRAQDYPSAMTKGRS